MATIIYRGQGYDSTSGLTTKTWTTATLGAAAAGKKAIILVGGHVTGSTAPVFDLKVGGVSQTAIETIASSGITPARRISAFIVDAAALTSLTFTVDSDLGLADLVYAVWTATAAVSIKQVLEIAENATTNLIGNLTHDSGDSAVALAHYRNTSVVNFGNWGGSRENFAASATTAVSNFRNSTSMTWSGLTANFTLQSSNGITTNRRIALVILFEDAVPADIHADFTGVYGMPFYADFTGVYELAATAGVSADFIGLYEILEFEINTDFVGTNTYELTADFTGVYALPFYVDYTGVYIIREVDDWTFTGVYELAEEFGRSFTGTYALAVHTPAEISQVPILALEYGDKALRFSQIPIIAVFLPDEDLVISQLPMLVLTHTKPIPPIEASLSEILPETPVTEVWIYKTVVNIMGNGREQRAMLRNEPRLGMRFNMQIHSDYEKRQAYEMVQEFIDKPFMYPVYQYAIHLGNDAAEGDTVLSGNLAHSDIRAGEKVALYDSETELVEYYTVASLSAPSTINLAEPLKRPYTIHDQIIPALWFRFLRDFGVNMSMIAGSMSLYIETLDPRPLQRVVNPALVKIYDGMPVLDDRRPPAADESFTKDVLWYDNDISRPEPYTIWKHERMGGTRTFVFDRDTGLAYWRAFAELVKGRLRPFLLPTFRDDIELSQPPALGAAALVSSDPRVSTHLQSPTHRWLRIVTGAGVLYRKVTGVSLTYGPDGVPNGYVMGLNTPLPNTVGSDNILMISYMHRTRLDTDEITLVHGPLKSSISFGVMTVFD